jgi:hypothetical protein
LASREREGKGDMSKKVAPADRDRVSNPADAVLSMVLTVRPAEADQDLSLVRCRVLAVVGTNRVLALAV